MAKIFNIKNNKDYKKNKKILEDTLKELKDKDINGFILSVETTDNEAAFVCASNPSILTLTQGYLNHLFLDNAYSHLENSENFNTEE